MTEFIYDVFDLTGLTFDPPTETAKQVKKKIDQKITELGSELGSESQSARQKELQGKIDDLRKFSSKVLSDDGKKLNSSKLMEYAKEKTATELSSLSSTIELLYVCSGTHVITIATIRSIKKKNRLSEENIRKAFTNAGIEIIEKSPKKDILDSKPKFPNNADNIFSELGVLRTMKDQNPKVNLKVVTDLYSFAAYISNDTDNACSYRAMETKELSDIFSAASRKYATQHSDLGKICASIIGSANKFVFNSEENRAAYDLYLEYHSDELTALFAAMKNVPKDTLLSPEKANACIKTICKHFPDYKVALAIYNDEAGFSEDEYYLPTEWVYTIKCSFCGTVNEFKSEADAMKVNTCNNCRKPLFKKCDKCGKTVPHSFEKCPHCGYLFASAELFSKYYQQSEAALRKNDFENARKYLFQAQSAAPGEKTRIDHLAKRISKEEEELKKPINRLRQLIAERKFDTAKRELGEIIGHYSNLNVSEFEETIDRELSKADRMWMSASNYPSSKKADVCVSILMQCVDFPPALAFLHSTAPIPCGSITVTPVSSAGKINVSWSHSTEQGVSYRLVRKKGMVAATSENDGDVIIDKTTSTSFSDEKVTPGQAYSYSVFAIRFGIYSSPVSKTGILFSDVINLRVSQTAIGVRITWDAPDNCHGTTITRICEGKTVTLTNTAHGSYEDSSTQYGKTYTYRVFANYDGNNRSSGIENVITPLPIVSSFSINATQIGDNAYKIGWTIKQQGIKLRVMANGKLLAESKSDDCSIQVSLPKDTFCKVNVLAFSGNKWVDSENCLEINTYTACKIDKKKTVLDEIPISGRSGTSYRVSMKIFLYDVIPSGVSAFYFSVRTANRWPTIEDVGTAPDIQRVSLETYKKNGFIPFQDVYLNEPAFYISVFTCFSLSGMKEVFSEPQKMKINRPLNANLFWSVTYGRFEGLKLMIELSGNIPIEYVPGLILCVCDADQFIASPNDVNAQEVLRIPSVDLVDSPVSEYSRVYSVIPNLTPKYLKKSKFFLFAQQEMTSEDKIMLRWKQGFLGKL